MKLADTIATHPKILRAGELLRTKHGTAEALALFIAGIGYSRHFLTNGFIPDSFLSTVRVSSQGEVVAKALSDRRVRLWHRTRGGYRIHDYFHWNEKASEVKEKRESERKRIAALRAAKRNGAP